MIKPMPPCLDCTDRHEICHDSCEEYLKFKSAREEYNELVRKQNDTFYEYPHRVWHRKKIQ